MEKARTEIRATEDCLRQILTTLVLEHINSTNERGRLPSLILEKPDISSNTLLFVQTLSYVFKASDLLDELSSDIHELQEVVATASDPSTRWQGNFFAVISAGSRRMLWNNVMQRDGVGKDEERHASLSSFGTSL